MTYLRELMKDYKNEVKEILAADKQLATEIQFDLKKWEEEMEARKAREEEEVWYFFSSKFRWLSSVRFISISQVIDHVTCYKSSALIGWNYSI